MGCVGLGNQPDRLATSLAAPMEPWMSLMEDAVICESGSNPDNMPCSSEQGASDRSEHREEGVLNATAEDFFSSLRQERWLLFILPAYYNQCTKQTLIPLISFHLRIIIIIKEKQFGNVLENVPVLWLSASNISQQLKTLKQQQHWC